VIINCTRERPWDAKLYPLGEGDRVSHENATETDDERDFGGGCYCVRMKCPDCGTTWWKELPQ
jgi:hypothetical protein